MSLSLKSLSDMVGGQLVGDGDTEITGAATLWDARKGDITFVEDPRLMPELAASEAAAVVAPPSIRPANVPGILVDDVRNAFTQIVLHFRPQRNMALRGISPAAHVCPTAKIAPRVDIHPGAVVGEDVCIGEGSVIHSGACIMPGCRLAENVTVFPCAVLHENTVVGPRTTIHAGAVLGSYGFGYDSTKGWHELGAQLGHVEIGADVEIGAGTTIDRGTFGPTRVGDGTKIDNQVMIGHNCRIGKHNLLCSQVGIAGSVTTGDYVVMAGQVGIRDHVHIADRVMLGARAGVSSDLTEPGKYFGAPARPDREQLQIILSQQKVPAMRRQLKALQESVDRLCGESPEPEAA